MRINLQFPALSCMFHLSMTSDRCLFSRDVFSAGRGMETVSPADGKVRTSFIRSKMINSACLGPHSSGKSQIGGNFCKIGCLNLLYNSWTIIDEMAFNEGGMPQEAVQI